MRADTPPLALAGVSTGMQRGCQHFNVLGAGREALCAALASLEPAGSERARVRVPAKMLTPPLHPCVETVVQP